MGSVMKQKKGHAEAWPHFRTSLLAVAAQGHHLRTWVGVVSEVQSCRVADPARWREGHVQSATPSYRDAPDRTSVVSDSEPSRIGSSKEDW